MIVRVLLTLLACVPPCLAQAPELAARAPEDGQRGVDPALRELTLTFDRDMDTASGWSICGGGPTFPAIERVAWRDARTLVVQVQLAPGTRYDMPLNCAGSSQRFRDAQGTPLAPTPWSFSTADTATADADQSQRNAEALEALRRLVEEEYSYRDRVVADWDGPFADARETILAAGSDQAFALRIGELLSAARDPHLWIGPREQLAPTFQPPRRSNFDPRAVERAVEDLEKWNHGVWSGTIADGSRTVGYLQIGSLSDAAALAMVQDLLFELAGSCQALVLDLRANGGGNELLALPIAAWFVEGEKVYAGHVRRNPESGAWDQVSQRRILGNGPERRFDGPVAVLIGPRCLSSCEAFVLMLRQAERAVLVGARTGGSSGNPQPHVLPNGVTVWLPSWRATDAEGRVFEGQGIAPDVEVQVQPGDFRERDPVLEAALEELKTRWVR